MTTTVAVVIAHIVSSMHLLGRAISPYLGYGYCCLSPKAKMFFVVFGQDRMLMSYEMDKREVCFIHKFGCGYRNVIFHISLVHEVISRWSLIICQ